MDDVDAGALGDEAWEGLTGGVVDGVDVRVVGARGHLPSRLAVEDVAVASILVALRAAAALHQQRGGDAAVVQLDRGHVAAAVRSERYFTRGGQPAGMGFAPLSRFWRTADGWVRTHANYRWHRAALRAALAADDADAIGAAMSERTADDIEAAVVAVGGVAGKVRTAAEWSVHPQGRAVGQEPLVSWERIGDAEPRRRDTDAQPASDIKVLDLTRVIAGPVCTRYLAALGADVLRLDPPHRPDLELGLPADTLLGKRSAIVDLRETTGRARLHELLTDADVVVCGYRPGALERYGLDPLTLAAEHPGIVVVVLGAWGHTGPWAARRGFDSIVQAPSGIAVEESADGTEPGALPCQLLDHATGYLAAAAALDGLRRQTAEGGTHVRRVSLARTAAWLISRRSPHATTPIPDDDATRWLATVESTTGQLTHVLPPGRLDGRPLSWSGSLATYGSDQPSW